MPMTGPGVEPLICLDISEWMGHTGEPTFRRWLMKLMQQQNGRILAFHIPMWSSGCCKSPCWTWPT